MILDEIDGIDNKDTVDMILKIVKLRQHAQVFVFAPPSQTRLVNRLKQIISLEGAQLSSSVLMMLCNSNGSYVYP